VRHLRIIGAGNAFLDGSVTQHGDRFCSSHIGRYREMSSWIVDTGTIAKEIEE
jgi:hypothetical protein